jgi:phage-related protein
MTWTIDFYSARVGRDVQGWPPGVYADFLRLAGMMELHGANLRMPHSRAMGEGLFELRCKGEEGIARAFYCTMVGRQIVILHGFVKKMQETPDSELKIARKRLKEVRRNG